MKRSVETRHLESMQETCRRYSAIQRWPGCLVETASVSQLKGHQTQPWPPSPPPLGANSVPPLVIHVDIPSAFSILSDRSTLSRLEGSLRLATPMAAPKTHSGFGNAILQGECLLESSPRSRISRRAVNNSREKREGGQSNHSLSSDLSSRKSQYLAVLSSQSQSQQHSWSWYTKSGAFTRVSESDTAPKNHVARGT